jgi:hypothetical protein
LLDVQHLALLRGGLLNVPSMPDNCKRAPMNSNIDSWRNGGRNRTEMRLHIKKMDARRARARVHARERRALVSVLRVRDCALNGAQKKIPAMRPARAKYT